MKGDSESDSCAAQETRKNVEQKELGPSALKQSEESTAVSDHMNTIRTVSHMNYYHCQSRGQCKLKTLPKEKDAVNLISGKETKIIIRGSQITHEWNGLET